MSEPELGREAFFRDGYLVGTWRHVVINICDGELAVDGVRAAHDAGVEIEREYGPRVAVLTVMWPTMRLPDASFRREAARSMNDGKERTKAMATVVPGTGFRASAFRSAFATLALASRTHFATRVAPDTETAARFLLEATGEGTVTDADVSALVAAVDAFRERARAGRPD